MALPLFEMGISGKPIAILKGGDRQLQFIKISKFNFKYFATKEGAIYDLDDEYEYRYKKKVSIFFYNFANNKPLSLMGMQEVGDKIISEGEPMLFNRDRYLQSLPPTTDFSTVKVPDDATEDMSPDTKRFLEDYSLDDEAAKTNMMLGVHHQKKPIVRYSPPLLGMGVNRGSHAIIQIGRKRIDIVPMVINNNRAYTKYGVFKTSNEDLYFYKKQVVAFFILSNDDNFPAEPMNRKSYGMMKGLARRKDWKLLETFHKPMEKDNTTKKNDPPSPAGSPDTNETSTLSKEGEPKKSVSLSSEKALVQFSADSPMVFHTTLKELHASKEIVATRLSDTLKKALPIVVIFGAVMLVAIVMSNAPPVLDKIGEMAGLQPPKIVYLTPDRVMKETGLTHEEVVEKFPLRPDYDPETLEKMSKEEQELLKAQESGGSEPSGTPSMTSPESPVNEDLLIPPNMDQIPPEIMLPEPIELYADTRDGLIVQYVAYGVDNVDGEIRADCEPDRGAWIPLGDHMVQCSVTDSAGNVTYGEFPLRIYGDEKAGGGGLGLPGWLTDIP